MPVKPSASLNYGRRYSLLLHVHSQCKVENDPRTLWTFLCVDQERIVQRFPFSKFFTTQEAADIIGIEWRGIMIESSLRKCFWSSNVCSVCGVRPWDKVSWNMGFPPISCCFDCSKGSESGCVGIHSAVDWLEIDPSYACHALQCDNMNCSCGGVGAACVHRGGGMGSTTRSRERGT